MPRTKVQGIIFGLLMSYSMAYGMEVYNNAIQLGIPFSPGGMSNLTHTVFRNAFFEMLYMGIIVFCVSELWGNRMGTRFMLRHCDPKKDNPYFCQLMRQAGTVAIMCPSMSLIASILFNLILGDASFLQLPAIWIGTVIKNLPMAFFWNMFAAAPFTRWVFGLLFAEKKTVAKHV